MSKKFEEQYVLKNINVEFHKGNIYGLIGRNGSGKTVLLKTICGFVPPTDGDVFVWNKHVGRDVDFPDSLGFVIESPGFLPMDSGLKNLKYLASIKQGIGADRIWECMELVGLDPNSRKPVGKYSLGMRQRLGIAQAIMGNSEILILDEPMNGLDNHGVEDIRSLLLGLKKEGKTIIIASHSAEDIDILCDAVYEMDAGMIRLVR
ncbi:ATP-binding cassette domain-containing protein [Caproiciproducens galactitolivorans]|uniref:ATP-binding cassette domain-containing protein n=1 Tax=Caproiciproducens galactitolivorans TaxID=642589 RepID=UPI00240A4F8F|nr:ATP-binding cassette domain-containing protein [Caproiciproducens galactitolivorans]